MAKRRTIISGIKAASLPARRKIMLSVGVVAILIGVAAYPALVKRAESRQTGVSGDTSDATVENLRAFAKLYGYVRYFHPSDEASAIDWERFAVHGVRQVKSARDAAQLRETLEALFLPIAPTIQIYEEDERPPVPAAVLTPEDTAGLQLVAWQHLGVGLGSRGRYRSVRLNRASGEATEPTSASFWKRIEAVPYRGKEIQLKAAVKTEGGEDGNQAHLMLYTELENREFGFVDDMRDRPVTATEWETYSITGTVAEGADSIGLAGFMIGSGKAWFDDFQLLVLDESEGQWAAVALENAGFESDPAGEPPAGWGAAGPGYRFSADSAESYDDERSLAIEYVGAPSVARPLFERRPEGGEVVNRPLGGGLSTQIPLALFSKDGQTLRPDHAPSLNSLEAALQNFNASDLTAAHDALRYANVVIAWNVLQHFYPYFDVVETDWDAVLTESLRRAGRAQSDEAFLLALKWMVAQLDDGHGHVQYQGVSNQARPPFLVDQIEGRVAIVAMADASEQDACFQRGDVVVPVDGIPPEQVLREAEEYISGSSQWKRLRALREFGSGERGSLIKLVLERPGQTVTCEVVRDFTGYIREERPLPIGEIQAGIHYVDLSRAETSAIEAALPALAEAEGVVFDLRGYPNGNNASVLRYLSSDTLHSTRWQVPQQIYPDQMKAAVYDTTNRWVFPPMQPHFQGEIVFLTDVRAISQAESILGIVEHYRLGEIVGQPTAGANGDVNRFTLPGGYGILWTGMRVVKHDGTQHHLVGIQPTVPVERTLAGVRAGRDELLEKALELIAQPRAPSGR